MNNVISEFPAVITKASFDKKTGVMRFRLVASDTSPDVFSESMSLELFNDFTSRIESGAEIPEPFKSILMEKSGWAGGMPYMSLAHYKSGVNGNNIPADTEKVYVDGEKLKGTAVCRNTPLGLAVFEALKKDIVDNVPPEDRIRISIGFLDLAHKHGDLVFERTTLDKMCPMCENNIGNKVYLKGQLVHLALTRRPANVRTDVTLEEKSMDIKSRQDDAASIVGEELAELVEVNRTALDDVSLENILTTKSDMEDDEDMEDEHTGEAGCTCKACKAKKEKEVAKSEVVDEVPAIEEAKSALDVAIESLKSKVMEMKSTTTTREAALEALQEDFELVAKAIRDEFAEAPVPAQVVATIDPALTELFTSMKTAIESLSNKVGDLTTEFAIMKSQASISQPKPENVVQPARNITVERTQNFMDVMAQKPLSISEIALRSVQTKS